MEKYQVIDMSIGRWVDCGRSLVLAAVFLFLFGTCFGADSLQRKEVERVENVARTFLEYWLLDGDVDHALSFVAEKPLMGTCLGLENEGDSWRKSRKKVIIKLKPLLST